MKVLSAGLLLTVCGASACTQSDDGATEISIGDGKADASAQIEVQAGETSSISFTAPAFPVELSVVCPISSNPDVVGTEFAVESSTLGLTSSSTHASLWQWSGEPDPGPATLDIHGLSGTAVCTVTLRRIAGECTSSTVSRSSETGHTHLRVGTEVSTWGDFPAAGNHWGAWAPWDTVYTRPVKRGFYLHNLEHGGLVLSYGCSASTDSAACAEAAAHLEALKDAFGEARVLVTPDPEQPSLYAVRAWRTGYQSDCYDEGRMLDFMTTFFRHGREDIDADPPVPYDPTTTNVPCVNIAAAPDSCR